MTKKEKDKNNTKDKYRENMFTLGNMIFNIPDRDALISRLTDYLKNYHFNDIEDDDLYVLATRVHQAQILIQFIDTIERYSYDCEDET